MSTTERPADARPGPGGGPLVRALRIFGLCGLAVAQPLLDVLGGGVAFFVTHDASRLQVLLVAVAVLLGPAALLVLVVEALRAWSVAVGERAMAVVVGLLLGVTIASAVDRAAALPLPAYAALLLVIGAAGATAYARLEPVRSFTTFLAPAPLLFAVVFLFFSPVRALVVGDDPESLAAAEARATDVVMVIFDELPLGALLDESGAIDEARFPGFARLAATSTWYPNATTVAPETTAAVPALLTGRLPEVGAEAAASPVAAAHPRSLFTMLGGSHDLRVHEWVTRLCPAELCDERAQTVAEEQPSLSRDVAVVAGHQVLPQRLADRVLPSISGQWAGFGMDSPATDGTGTGDPTDQDGPDGDGEAEARPERHRFGAALQALEAEASPQLWFAHERLPHRPSTLLPDGTRYPRAFPFDWWSHHRPDASIVYRQQFQLQVKYVDRLLEQLLDRLEREDLEDALLVVVSDHGLSFRPHGHPRAYSSPQPSELADVLPVPLFVRYPSQEDGEVDPRDASVIDVVPTVADVVGVQLPTDWEFDGRSLRAEDAGERRQFWQPLGELSDDLAVADPLQLARENAELFGPGGGPHDLYAMGPHGDLVGEALQRGDPVEEAVVEPLHHDAYDDVDPESGRLPAFYEAEVSGLESGQWVAVAVDDVVAGVGLVIEPSEGPARIKAMLDPSLFLAGSNDVEAFLVDEDTSTLRPIARAPESAGTAG
ncbi:sulfatase-like hydrolase/transferase [Egicoccus sp. AB-alg2]|uniref:sulfatase-like hydrolase/transferase n=1 Tax=Egicoccus sp. AB-alg2 TaxID=3242693 RepID=UPI00359E04D4